jgi:hypothetical protein
MLQNAIFAIAGAVYFVVTSLAHRKRVQRWQTGLEHSGRCETSHSRNIPPREF